MMMTAEKFNSYSKADLYKIYCELYQKLEEKDSLIAEHVVTVSEFLKKSTQVTTNSAIITPTINTSAKNDVFIRKFETLEIEEKTENFLIGSSIIKHLARDRTFPQDCSIHAYPGSTTKEKLQLLQGYDQKKMKTVILQDGTNAILKQKSDHLETLFSDYKDLVSAIQEKFSPESLVLMEVPPLKKLPKNEQTNNKIYEFNEKLREYITQENTEKIKILPVCNMLSQMANYNALFYDDIHFNFQQGIPFIKNAVLSHFLLTSCNLVRLQPLQYSQSAYVSRANTYKRWRQTYRYTNGF